MPAEQTARPVIFGEVLYDRFPDGSVVLGGAPFNVAWHLQAFGQQPVFISRVGNDSLGRNIHQAMQRWGMTTAGMQQDSQHPTGTVEVHINDGEPSYDIVPDRAYDFVDADALPPLQARLLYHGTLAVRGPRSAQALARLKAHYNMPILLDVNLRPPWWKHDTVKSCMDDARWIKLNDNELEALVPGTGDATTRAKGLITQHALELVVITRGQHGAMAFSRSGNTAEVRPRDNLEIVDTVGAGDAFTSVLILGLLQDWSLEIMLQRAQEFASAIVGIRGATTQDTQFYHPFIQHWGLSTA